MSIPNPHQSSFLAPAIACGVMAFGLHLAPDGRTLVGWDEWILAEITGRLSHVSMRTGDIYGALVPTSYAYPPVFFWLSSAAVALLGPAAWVYRLGTALGAAACASLTAMIGFRVGGRWCGSIAGTLAALSMSLQYYDTVSMDPLMTAFILGGTYAFLRYLDGRGDWNLVLALLLTGLACTVKYHAVIFHGALCVAAIFYLVRAQTLRRHLDLLLIAALVGPAALLVLEALTAHLYGWNKTHIAEAIRMNGWPAFVQDPMTGAITRPTLAYYPTILFLNLGLLQSVLAIGGSIVLWQQGGSVGRWLFVFMMVWFGWAMLLEMKHGRYLLPMLFLLFVAIGFLVATVSSWDHGWHTAVVITAILVVGSGIQAKARMDEYGERVNSFIAVIKGVETHLPEGTPLLSDSRPLQGTVTTGLLHIDRPIRTPFAKDWRDTEYLLTHEMGFQSIREGAMTGVSAYPRWREEALDEWEVLLDQGTGLERVRLLRRSDH